MRPDKNYTMDSNVFQKLAEVESRELMPGFRGKFIHMEHMTIAYWEIAKGSTLPHHHHVHEQTTNVISGELELTVDGDTRVLKFGEVAAIPSNVPHSGKALTDCVAIDVFSPVREDYRAAED